MRLKILTLTVLIALTYSLNLKAQFNDSVLGIGVMVGGSKLSGDIKNTNAGFTGGFLLRYTPITNFSIGASTSFGNMTSGLDAIKTEIFSSSLFANYFIMPYSLFNPFLSLGFSNFHYWASDENNNLIRSSKTGHSFKGWDSAIQIGIGMELAASRHWAVNTMGNYSFTRNDGLDAIVDGSNDGFFKGTVALVRYFDVSGSAGTGRKHFKDYRSSREKMKITQIEKTNLPPKTKTKSEQTGSKSFSNGISFEPGTAILLNSSTVQLNNIYNFLNNNPNEQIELVGKTTHTKKTNRKLLIARAKAIKTYLVNKGISTQRIIIHE